MERTQIYLDRRQRGLLTDLARRRGVSLSELIREAIWNFIAKYQKPKTLPLQGIVGIYNDPEDALGSTQHDKIYD